MSTFHAGKTEVSMSEMNHNPLQTVQIIHQSEGWEWASRLWQEWDRQYAQTIGYPNPQADASRRVRKWLDERRPTPPTPRP